jgi:hypothetical protein
MISLKIYDKQLILMGQPQQLLGGGAGAVPVWLQR